jgi:hypothetical protein
MMSEQQVDDAYTQGLGALTALGRGERASVGSSLTQMARQSASQAANDASISLMNRQGDAAMAGQLVGFGVQQGMSRPSTGSGMTVDPTGFGMGFTTPQQKSLPTAGGA